MLCNNKIVTITNNHENPSMEFHPSKVVRVYIVWQVQAMGFTAAQMKLNED